MSDLVNFFKPRQQAMIDLLRDLVLLESPTIQKTAVDQLGAYLSEQCLADGATVEPHPRAMAGNNLLAKWNVDAPGKPILILSHMDTVWPLGTVADRLPTLDGEGRLYGPGALDMKGGIVIALEAVKGLQKRGELPDRPIWYLLTSDEEMGSKHSQELIEQCAKGAALVLVTEPPNADGSLKSWRKGVATYQLTIKGREAHAGNEPEQGINAIIEFAQQAMELNALNDLKYGTSVSVTMVEGGTAGNVIPGKVQAHIDTRTISAKEAERLHERIMDRAPYIPGAEVHAELLNQRPPMERNAETVDKAKQIAKAAGITIREDGAGGGSDGNFTAAMGIPTLDGLGAEGIGLHAQHEHVLINSLPKKAALMAAILRDWPVE